MARRGRKEKKASNPNVAVGYIRVSKDEQQLSPDAQRAAMERWCGSRNIQLIAVHEDIGIRGAVPLDKRPGLLAAINSLKEHCAGILLVTKRDRLARDVVVAETVERLVKKYNARIFSADGIGNDNTPEARLMRGMIDLINEYQRLVLGAQTKAALDVKRACGQKISGLVPYGYRVAEDGKTLEPYDPEQQVINLVQLYRREGITYREVGDRLISQGFLPRSGKRWHPQILSRIAKQEIKRST